MTWSQFKDSLTYHLFGPHLEKEEKILMVVHRQPFSLIWDVIKLGFLSVFLPIFFWNVFPEVWFLCLIWILYGVVKLDKKIFKWYFDSILITNMSLIDVTWNGFFERSAVRLEYAMIEGTSVGYNGFLQTIFRFGTIKVMRQGGIVGIELTDAMRPAKVESVILNYQEKYLADSNISELNNLKGLLGGMVKKHLSDMKEVKVDF